MSPEDQTDFLEDLPPNDRNDVLAEMAPDERADALRHLSEQEKPGTKRGGLLQRNDGIQPGQLRRGEEPRREKAMRSRLADDEHDALGDSGMTWLDENERLQRKHAMEWNGGYPDPNEGVGREYQQSSNGIDDIPRDAWGNRRPRRYGERPSKVHPLHAQSQYGSGGRDPRQRGLTKDPDQAWLDRGGQESPHWNAPARGLESGVRQIPVSS